jgi:hypothetical protein
VTRYLVTYRLPSGEVCSSGHVFLDRAQGEADAVQKRGWTFLRIADIEPLKAADYSPGHKLRR